MRFDDAITLIECAARFDDLVAENQSKADAYRLFVS
jgi:hypothetical protein